MAWIIGLVSDAELAMLRQLGLEDVDPPDTMLSEDELRGERDMQTRAFFCDEDVLTIVERLINAPPQIKLLESRIHGDLYEGLPTLESARVFLMETLARPVTRAASRPDGTVVYFEDRDGFDLAYWIPGTGRLMAFAERRAVHSSMRCPVTLWTTYLQPPEGCEEQVTIVLEVVRSILGESIDTGGCKAFYSPAEWLERQEEFGLESELIIVHDGGDLAPLFNLDYNTRSALPYDKLSDGLAKHGYWVEMCTSWYSALYRRTPHQEVDHGDA